MVICNMRGLDGKGSPFRAIMPTFFCVMYFLEMLLYFALEVSSSIQRGATYSTDEEEDDDIASIVVPL